MGGHQLSQQCPTYLVFLQLKECEIADNLIMEYELAANIIMEEQGAPPAQVLVPRRNCPVGPGPRCVMGRTPLVGPTAMGSVVSWDGGAGGVPLSGVAPRLPPAGSSSESLAWCRASPPVQSYLWQVGVRSVLDFAG